MIFVLDFGRGLWFLAARERKGSGGGEQKDEGAKAARGESKNKKRLPTPSTIDSDSVKNP